MSIIISINPPHTDNILCGKKTNEWRTKPLPLGKAFIYETLRNGCCGMVVGEVEIVENILIDPTIRYDELIEKGCVSVEYIGEYLKRKDGERRRLYANLLTNAKRFEVQRYLMDFYKPCIRKDNDCQQCEMAVKACTNPFDDPKVYYCKHRFTRPPQSWCYTDSEV